MRPGCCAMVSADPSSRCSDPASYEVKGGASDQWHPWCTRHLVERNFGKTEHWKVRRWRPGRNRDLPRLSPQEIAERIYQHARQLDPWPGGPYSVGFDSSGKVREVEWVNSPVAEEIQGGHAITFPIRHSWKENFGLAAQVKRPSDFIIKDVT